MYAFSGNAYAGKKSFKDEPLHIATASHIQVDDFLVSAAAPDTILEDSTVVKNAVVENSTVSSANFDPFLVELEQFLAGMTFKDEPRDKDVDRATKLVQAYLLKNEPQFHRVMKYRDRGWHDNKQKGDSYFKKQRAQADTTETKGEKIFFDMMIRIAEEMHRTTGSLHLHVPVGRNLKVLDVCMAPGGYSAAVLKVYPRRAEIYGITLSKAEGGHSVVLCIDKLKGLKQCDVTMLSTELLDGTNRIIPKQYPDYAKLNPIRPFRFYKMDLIFLDGQVLRTHERASFRQNLEPVRLRTAQLILAMQRIAQGGTLIMLMHKVEKWDFLSVIYAFSKFAKVELFKPTTAHTTRSSFYLIAKEVDPQSPWATAALSDWKDEWYTSTCGGKEGTGLEIGVPGDTLVLEVLKVFGPQLIRMGVPLWRIQADALSKTTYAGDIEEASVADVLTKTTHTNHAEDNSAATG